MIFFFDASSLIKLYIQEPGSDTTRLLVQHVGDPRSFYTSDHVCLEVLATLSRKLRRGPRKARRNFHPALEKFNDDRENVFNVVTVESEIVKVAFSLAVEFAASGAGSLDILHLAAADHVHRIIPNQPLIFVVADRQLRSLAARMGFDVFDPEKDDLDDLPAPSFAV